uniref:Uncharacterized protein n=1 Tax=Physcomitrium patens TaxID=3218 RepID=A0A2K1JLC0_PHYPA|nr:hypothetical protein PHYPA_017138 [Physcomitrium patens]
MNATGEAEHYMQMLLTSPSPVPNDTQRRVMIPLLIAIFAISKEIMRLFCSSSSGSSQGCEINVSALVSLALPCRCVYPRCISYPVHTLSLPGHENVYFHI